MPKYGDVPSPRPTLLTCPSPTASCGRRKARARDALDSSKPRIMGSRTADWRSAGLRSATGSSMLSSPPLTQITYMNQLVHITSSTPYVRQAHPAHPWHPRKALHIHRRDPLALGDDLLDARHLSAPATNPSVVSRLIAGYMSLRRLKKNCRGRA